MIIMRKNYLFKVFACAALATSLVVTGCGTGSKTTDTTKEESSEDSVKGMIQSVSDTEITVAVMGDAPDQQSGDAKSDSSGQKSDGQPPERPSGDSQDSDGQPPERPSGDSQNSDGQSSNESSDDNQNSKQETTQDSSASEQSDSNENTENNSNQSQDASSADGQASEQKQGGGPGGNMETKTYTITDSTEIKDADGNSITVADLSQGTMVEITCDANNQALTITVSDNKGPGGAGGNGGVGGNTSQPSSYEATNSYKQDTTVSGKTLESTGTDESAVYVSEGANVTLKKTTITRSSSDSTGGDTASFYGVGAAALTTNGTLTIEDSTITTDSAGGAGVFAYGDGVVKVSNTTIMTKQDTSGGIHVAGGGTLEASNLTVETNGESSAAIRSDRGGGTMKVTGGTYTSNGKGSPAVYCTADISVADAALTANGSEAVCIEGLNSLSLENCTVTSNMPENEQNDCIWSIILYQSMSGDSEVGNSQFSMKDGSLISKNGGLFYTTNTQSTFTLENVAITTSDSNDFFLKCTGNSNARGWGETGKNGAQCSFTAINQEMPGDVIWDSISELDLSLQKNSVLTGAIIQDESNAGDGGDGYANVTIDSTSKWIVTGDSTVTKLVNKGKIVDADGNTVTIKDTDGTVLVKGTSSYTVTVSSYE